MHEIGTSMLAKSNVSMAAAEQLRLTKMLRNKQLGLGPTGCKQAEAGLTMTTTLTHTARSTNSPVQPRLPSPYHFTDRCQSFQLWAPGSITVIWFGLDEWHES